MIVGRIGRNRDAVGIFFFDTNIIEKSFIYLMIFTSCAWV